MKFDNFSAVDDGFVNFAVSNAPNPFIYNNVLSIDILPFPSVNFLNSTYGVSLTPNRKLILQTRRLSSYSGIDEASVIFPKLIQARHRFFQLFIADTGSHTSSYWDLTMNMYNNYLSQLNSTIIPLGYRIDKSINNNLILDKITNYGECGNADSLLNNSIAGYFPTKYQCMLTTPTLNVSGSCLILRLIAKNGTPNNVIEMGISQPKFRFNALVQTLSNRPLKYVSCGSYPRTLNQSTIQQNTLLNQLNNDLQTLNTALNIDNCKIQVVSGRFPLTMLPQIANT